MTNAERDRVIAEYLEPLLVGNVFSVSETLSGIEKFTSHLHKKWIEEKDGLMWCKAWPNYFDARNWARLLGLANIEIQISLIPSCPKWRVLGNSGAVDFFFEGETLGEVVPNCAYAIAVAANEKEGNDG